MSEFNYDDNDINTKDKNDIKILSSLYPQKLLELNNHYFFIKGENKLGALAGFVSVNQSMEIAYPNKTIDWESVPTDYLIDLFLEKEPQLFLPFSQELMALKVDMVCLDKSFFEENYLDKQYLNEQGKLIFPVIKTNIGDLYVSSIIGKYNWVLLSENKLGAIVNFTLGSSQISLSLLKTLSIGDILLIDNVSFEMNISGKKWATFKWEERDNVMELDEMLENDKISEKMTNKIINSDEEIPANVDLKSIGTIPITVSFLLSSKVFLIEQIEKLAPGQQILLSENTSRNIILMANGTAIAKGELVKIGDRFAVEIQNNNSLLE